MTTATHTQSRHLPAELARERDPLLRRVLGDLPTPMLEALLRGLARHEETLRPGHLAAPGGGCAVGVMLEELAGRSLRGRCSRWRPRWTSVRTFAPSLARRHPRLPHLELVYDVTCERLAELRPGSPERDARDVGLWMARHTTAELDRRSDRSRSDQLGSRHPPTPSQRLSANHVDPDLGAEVCVLGS